ncbi:hypothetical protein GE061_002944 [Apolygus lucorum]|uniref:Gustatory receptor n=1 Tax=Apolygus lucorum TaxID=248454 RepID=A0A8S9X0P9_APOLU|nr:hypothetical protein GE061_002944 [Apolygus lucorum]
MFLAAARFFGSFPYTNAGEFDFIMYMFYMIQLAVAVGCRLITSMLVRIDDWRQSRVDKLSICVHVVGLWAYFLPLMIQPLMTLKRRPDFEFVSAFFANSTYPPFLRYISHLGCALVVAIMYFSVFGLLIVQRFINGTRQVMQCIAEIHMHYIYGLDFLVTMQHTSLVHRVSMEFFLTRRRLKYELFEATDYAQGLFRISKTANMIYGPQLVVRVTQSLITMMTFAYGTITNTSPHGNTTILEKMGEMMILIIIIAELWCLCGTCDDARANAEAFNNELFKIMRESRDLCSNKKLRLYVTMKQTVEFTACGFFSLGYSLVTSVIAASTTYLVILVQFSMTTG